MNSLSKLQYFRYVPIALASMIIFSFVGISIRDGISRNQKWSWRMFSHRLFHYGLQVALLIHVLLNQHLTLLIQNSLRLILLHFHSQNRCVRQLFKQVQKTQEVTKPLLGVIWVSNFQYVAFWYQNFYWCFNERSQNEFWQPDGQPNGTTNRNDVRLLYLVYQLHFSLLEYLTISCSHQGDSNDLMDTIDPQKFWRNILYLYVFVQQFKWASICLM